MVDVGRLELPTPSLQSVKSNLPNLAGADATRLEVTGCDKTKRAVFLLFIRFLSKIASVCHKLYSVFTTAKKHVEHLSQNRCSVRLVSDINSVK